MQISRGNRIGPAAAPKTRPTEAGREKPDHNIVHVRWAVRMREQNPNLSFQHIRTLFIHRFKQNVSTDAIRLWCAERGVK